MDISPVPEYAPFTAQAGDRGRAGRRRKNGEATFAGARTAPYSDEERELIYAIDAFRRRTGCRFPSHTQVLGVARSLGWVRAPHGFTLVPLAPPAGGDAIAT